MVLILLVLESLGLVVMMAGIIYLLLHMASLLRDEAPFVSMPRTVLSAIVEVVNVQHGDVVYDLGCGDGRVLFALWEKEPRARYVGIENSYLPYIMAQWNLKRNKGASIHFERTDMFTRNLSDASIVFTYLLPQPMVDLLPKFQKELRPGTRVVSCDFSLPNIEPQKIIELGRTSALLAHRLFVYQF